MSRAVWMGFARRTAALACVVLSLSGSSARTTEAYAVLNHRMVGFGLRSAGEEWKLRWDAAVWAPGTTLTVAVPDDPRWLASSRFRSMVEVREEVSESLRQWQDIGTADIRWRVGTAVETEAAALEVVLRDGLSRDAQVFISVPRGNEAVLDRCKILIDPESLDSSALRYTFVHELGHCLGLDHPPPHPNDGYFFFPRGYDAYSPYSMWGYGPVMSYGRGAYDGRTLTSDRIGASLLRPAPGWLERTGSVYGTVLGTDPAAGNSEHEGASVVLIARVGLDGTLGDAVTRYTNLWGQFVIEGLTPGNYVLMVAGTQPDPGHWWVPNIIWETVLLRPVAIRAGERQGPLVLTVHREEDE